MNKSDPIFQAMTIINEHETLIPGICEYDVLVEQITSLIDQLGREKALEQVRKAKALLLEQVHRVRH
ncbi:hypothetical protein [uncultured Desulfosarcina sp.]|uniref:hypothetical protein n=1 Tax=uncultured Desulfosarcina sp. TaxID=218289 RepID=UPI0029C98E0D|nr:hypothetical protein [uncultured Desulfosarcina sp.]